MHFQKSENEATPASKRSLHELTRRSFLQFTTVAGSGLTLGILLGGCGSTSKERGREGSSDALLVMPFLRIDRDSTVTVLSKHLEAGQGVWTGLTALVAEELDASWRQMRVENAPAKVPDYGNLAWDPRGSIQATGGSTSIANSWDQLRRAGATARAMLVAAAATQWRVPAAEITVHEGFVSHPETSKRATFGELAERAARLPVPTHVRLKDPSQFRFIGRELPRLDSRAKCTGTQRYAIDVVLPQMMTAVVRRPPLFGARAVSFDARPAKAVPGVVDVVPIPRGLAVVAHDTWSALKGREALQVAWDESSAEKRSTDQIMEYYRSLSRTGQAATALKRGDVERALAQADTVIDAEFEFPYLAHAPMEPLTAVCRLSADRCEIWAGSQDQTLDQAAAAAVAGLDPNQVTINTLAAGGSFGRRATPDSDFISEVVSIARATGGRYPVRLIWTREDDITGGRYRPLNYHRVTVGVDEHRKVFAYRQRVVGQSLVAGTQFAGIMRNGVDPIAVEGSAPEQYDLDHVHVTWSQPEVGVPTLWWRSVGHTHMAFSKEVLIDERAEATNSDPVAFRLALLRTRPRHAATLKLCAEKAGWYESRPKRPGHGRGVAIHESYGTVVAQIADVAVTGDTVRVDRVVCAVDCGLAVTPNLVRAQMRSGIGYGLCAALHGQITLTNGRVDQTNFHQYPVLRLYEMPRVIDVHIVPSTNPPSGVGEPGVPPIAPAVANAIRAATGLRVRKLPFDLASLRRAAQ